MVWLDQFPDPLQSKFFANFIYVNTRIEQAAHRGWRLFVPSPNQIMPLCNRIDTLKTMITAELCSGTSSIPAASTSTNATPTEMRSSSYRKNQDDAFGRSQLSQCRGFPSMARLMPVATEDPRFLDRCEDPYARISPTSRQQANRLFGSRLDQHRIDAIFRTKVKGAGVEPVARIWTGFQSALVIRCPSANT